MLLLVACGGGGGGGDGGSPPPGDDPPLPVISSPAASQTFRAGDTIQFRGSATDPEDGTLAPSRLTWWVELHHDTHTHPFRPPTSGASGSALIPVRGETSPNVWYRFHLRATDSAGQSATVTRDIRPQKSRITLATQPAGLQLTLDGQPVAAPHAFTGVVGLERDLGAPEQVRNGRRWRLASWSDGGAGSHTIATPSADTTYTASFVDIGPASNEPPSVTLSAPATALLGSAVTLSASASDSDGRVVRVEFFDGTTSLGADTTNPYGISWTPGSAGAHLLTARATDDAATPATTTSATVTLSVTSGGGGGAAPVATLTAPGNFSAGLSGTLTLTANASDDVGVAGVEFQIDGMPIGAEDTTQPYSASLNTALHAAGQHVLRARARDAAGNRSPWSSVTVEFGGGAAAPQGFTIDDDWVFFGFPTLATAFTQAPDGRFFVCEQGGALRVVKNGQLLATPFKQFANVNANGERGVLGVALHPGFASNGWVYVYYTTTEGGIHNRVVRLVANGDVSDGSQTVILELPTLSSENHNGGALKFGPDGKLYVAVGDNTDTSAPQNLASPLGKMLRLNDDGSVPADNPFFTGQNTASKVWAYGLRNPFTFAIDSASGRMHINDVGSQTWEEVDLGARGANYGWPASEGPDGTAGFTAPLFAYNHSPASPPGSGPGGFFTGLAIIGGAFYPTSGAFPAAYRGDYYFADNAAGWVARMDLANDNAVYAFAQLGRPPVGMLAGTDGALYVLTYQHIVRISAP